MFQNIAARVVLLLSCLLFTACGGGGGGGAGGASSGTGSTGVGPALGTIEVRQLLLRALPTQVTEQRFTGFNAEGEVLYGPETRPKAESILLQSVPVGVVRLQIDYFSGSTLLGLSDLAVTVLPDQTLVINDPPLERAEGVLIALQITPGRSVLGLGTAQQLTAVGTYADNSQRDLSELVSWSSSDVAVATVGPKGRVEAVTPGGARITGRLGDVSASAVLEVSSAEVRELSISSLAPSQPPGTFQQMSAMATLTDGTQQDVTAVASWTSSAPAVARIGGPGLITALETGSAEVGASLAGASVSLPLQVTSATVESLTVQAAETLTLALATSARLRATAGFSDGSRWEVAPLWSSDDAEVAQLSPDGYLTAKKPGVTEVEARFAGQTAVLMVTVSNAQVASVSVNPSSLIVGEGEERSIAAVATLGDGTTQEVTETATWVVSDTSVATISPEGVLTGVTPGQTTATVTVAQSSSQVRVTVTEGQMTALLISPSTARLAQGGAIHLQATAVLSGGRRQDVSSEVSWSSSASNHASIDSAGRALGVSPGATTISASLGGFTATSEVEVILSAVSWTPQVSGTSQGLTSAAYGAGRYVVVGEKQTILSSSDTLVWSTELTGGPSSPSLSGVAFGAGKFVAVGELARIWTSTDGRSWMEQNLNDQHQWDVVYGKELFVSVGDGGTVLTSPNGLDWTPRVSGTTGRLESVCYGNGLFVATGFAGEILTSPDGIEWMLRSSGNGEILYGVAVGQGRFVAVGSRQDEGLVVTSDDGGSWSVVEHSEVWRVLADVTFAYGQFVAVGFGGQILTSADGLVWVERDPAGPELSVLYSVELLNDHLVTVGGYGAILTSP